MDSVLDPILIIFDKLINLGGSFPWSNLSRYFLFHSADLDEAEEMAKYLQLPPSDKALKRITAQLTGQVGLDELAICCWLYVC